MNNFHMELMQGDAKEYNFCPPLYNTLRGPCKHRQFYYVVGTRGLYPNTLAKVQLIVRYIGITGAAEGDHFGGGGGGGGGAKMNVR